MWSLPESDERFFSASERASVDALFATLFPQDLARGIPGAADAHAAEFVDRLLALPEAYEEIAAWQSLYRDGLVALDTHSKTRFGSSLADLPAESMQQLLADLETGALVGLSPAIDQANTFRTLWRHCIQGCFADPRWGGNRDRVMWRWLGYLQDREEVLR